MTISTNIKCDVCGHTFTLKSQMDDSIYVYDWPIVIVCPTCNNHLELFMNVNGLSPKEFLCSKRLDNSTHLGYSATLPVCNELYYKQNNHSINPFFSSYINLSSMYGLEAIENFKKIIERLLNGVIPYRRTLKELYPCLLNKNIETFLTKMANIFKCNKKSVAINKNLDCNKVFTNLINTIYEAIKTQEYEKKKCSYFNEVLNFVQTADPNALNNIISMTSSFQCIDDWVEQKAFNYVAEVTTRIEKYMPALFYSSLGSFTIPHTDGLNILTIDYKQASEDYAKGFEIISKIIPLVIALHNMMRNGDCNIYREGECESNNALSRLNNTFGGKRKQIVETYPDLKEYFEYTMENHIRNGENHCEINYDVMTQIISYKYNINNLDSIHRERLIDLCLRVYLQFMRIIEIIKIVTLIKNRVNCLNS